MAHPIDAHAAPSGWHIAGCGAMGCLAAAYLRRAGWPVTVIRDHGPARQATTLMFPGAPDTRLDLPVVSATETAPIRHLLVACKTPYTQAALHGLNLAPDATVLRLQNGIGSLDGLLRPGQRCIELITASAVKRDTDGRLTVVAENTSEFGGGAPPAFWPRLARAWPGAVWQADIGPAQRAKLAVNAIINPLTALYDRPNGALLDNADMQAEAHRLADEADRILAALDPTWAGDALTRAMAVARATAANTSSMRADLQTGARTEIEAINGWLVAQAGRLGLAAPAHDEIITRIRARYSSV